ncbi:hypothetical protein BOTBODRAFT_181641 [Botryobasidium botryosum FD-172 SS1]|uniref:Integral membrane protein n=1 Tax=Botryobasidium botryosum (strain FD-172 SS1) TaxID=930990 RepID=A0A067LT10_BOTB1|nr:hypothetical protein BOTBODRAFT_181641 [Botryobasidium botryosum FD-172 SS1]
MASDSDFVDVLTTFIAIFAEIFLYGIYALLFFVCLWVMLFRNNAPNWKLITPLVTMFIVSTAHFAVALYAIIEAFVQLPSSKDGHIQDSAVIAAYGLYNVLSFIGDGIVIYRYHVICDSGFKIVVLPIMLFLANTSLGIYSTASLAFEQGPFWTTAQHFTLATLCSSLVLNTVCTGLITHRIWASTRIISPAIGSRHAAKCYAVLAIIVESAAIWTISTAVVIGTYVGHAPHAVVISFEINVQIVVRSPLSSKLPASISELDSLRPSASSRH